MKKSLFIIVSFVSLLFSYSAFAQSWTCLIDKSGKFIFAHPFTWDVYPPDDADGGMFLLKIRDNGKYGFIDKTGNFFVFDRASSFSEGLASVTNGGKSGYIDASGRFAIPCKYDIADSFSSGIAYVMIKDGICGYIDKTGNIVIPRSTLDNYEDWSWNFYEGLAPAKKDGKYGFIDKTGKLVVPCIYDRAEDFCEGMALVEKDGKYGFIDKTGKLVVPCIYDEPNEYGKYFSGGMALVKKDGHYGFVDKTGKLVIPFTTLDDYDDFADEWEEGMVWVEKDGKMGFLDKTGKLVVPCTYDDVKAFSDGLAIVEKDGKHGYINKSGKLVIPCIYSNAKSFSEGLAAVQKENGLDNWGFIDKTGKSVIPFTFSGIQRGFTGGFAVVNVSSSKPPKIESASALTQDNHLGPKQLSDSEMPSFSSPISLFSFLSRHVFRSNEGTRLIVNSDAVTANGTVITYAPDVIDLSKDEAELRAKSPFSNTTYQLLLIRNGNTYILKVSTLPSYQRVENYYLVQ